MTEDTPKPLMNVLRNSLTALPGRFDPDTGTGGATGTTAPGSVEPEQNTEPEQGTDPIVNAPTEIDPGTAGAVIRQPVCPRNVRRERVCSAEFCRTARAAAASAPRGSGRRERTADIVG